MEGEPEGHLESYGDDRLFVYMSSRGEEDVRAVEDLVRAGHPVVRIPLDGIYDLGGEMFRWEMATAIAGRRLGINPFNQPNVETAKALARSESRNTARRVCCLRSSPRP